MNERMIAHIAVKQYDLTEMTLLGQAIGALLREKDGEELEKLLDDAGIGDVSEGEGMEMTTEAALTMKDKRLILSWDESEASGLEGTHTEISFEPAKPGLIHLIRTGRVTMELILEKGRRHLCTYQTPYMPFELCVVTREAENTVTPWGGKLRLDYLIEIKGAAVQRMCLDAEIRRMPEAPAAAAD